MPRRALIALVLLVAGATVALASPAPAREPGAATVLPRRQGVTGVKVVAAGDIACAPGAKPSARNCQQAATAKLVTALDPALVIALGDNQYNRGGLADYRAVYGPTWGAFKGRTRAIPGNHEYHTPGARGFFRYFKTASPGYRAITVGGWRVYLLNSMCEQINCAAERAWFKADLASHPTACSAIALHYPRYSSGSEHGSDPAMAPFWTIAHRYGVDLALAGHDHNYERFAPMDGAGHRLAGGITSFVVGTGGRSLYHLGTRVPGSRYFANNDFGVLALTLGDGEFGWQFRTVGGAVRDAGSRSCH